MAGSELFSVGQVVEAHGDTVLVRFKRTKACGECKMCASFGSDEAMVEVENRLSAKVGDKVELALHSASMLKASFIVYVIPLLALLSGVLIGIQFSDLLGAALGIAAAVVSLLIIHFFEPRFKRKREFQPRMIRILESHSCE